MPGKARCMSSTTFPIWSSNRSSRSRTGFGRNLPLVSAPMRSAGLPHATRSVRRRPHRQRAASAARTDEWLTAGHRRVKLIANCVANRSQDGPDTPGGVRARVARANDPAAAELVGRLDDATIAAAIRCARNSRANGTTCRHARRCGSHGRYHATCSSADHAPGLPHERVDLRKSWVARCFRSWIGLGKEWADWSEGEPPTTSSVRALVQVSRIMWPVGPRGCGVEPMNSLLRSRRRWN